MGRPMERGNGPKHAMSAYPRLHLIQRGAKLGLGTAIKAGLKHAIEHQYGLAVNLDADFSHDPSKIPR